MTFVLTFHSRFQTQILTMDVYPLITKNNKIKIERHQMLAPADHFFVGARSGRKGELIAGGLFGC
jgi:hypothetical protein